MTTTPTHRQLCERAARWLKGSKGCSFSFFEIVCYASEIADAVGFSAFRSFMIEVKVSRSDFLRDQHKRHRKTPEQGIGNKRYYLCPPDVITPSDLPANWGLLYTAGRKIRIVVEAKDQDSNLFVERTLLTSVMRRALYGCPNLKEKFIGFRKKPEVNPDGI